MNWPAVIAALAIWLALMIWTGRARDRVLAVALLMTSGYLLLPVPVDLPLSEVFGLKAAVVTLTGAAVLALGKTPPIRRPQVQWWDAFMAAWLLVQVAAEIANARPAASALVVGAEMFIQWALPYALGRIVLRRASDLIVVARLVVLGGLLLVPPAIYESLSGHFLHRTLYGIALISSITTYHLILNAWGPVGFRPMLFFEGSHLAASFYFGAAAVVQAFLIAGGGGAFGKRKWDILTLVLLIATAIDSRAFLGIAVLLAGSVILLSVALWRTRLLLIVLLLGLPVYIGLRATGIAPTPQLTGRGHADPFHKNYSLWFRMYQEDVAMQTIQERRAEVLGLGSAIPGDQDWRQFKGPVTGLKDIYWIDSLWVWLLIRTGWLGLSVAYLAVMTPLMAAVAAIPPMNRDIKLTPEIMACLGMLVVVGLDLMDWTMNSHQSTLWAFALGGLASVGVAWRQQRESGVHRGPVRIARLAS